MDNVVTLRFGGLSFDFWQDVAINMSVDDLVATVELAFAKSDIGKNFPVTVNTVAQVLMNGWLVATVRPDMVRRRIGPEQHTNSFNGRSLGRELVDTQYSATYKNVTVTEIVSRICSLFKVPLTPLQKTALVPDFSMQSESPANAIINAARTANILIYPTPEGGLIMAEPDNGQPVATLVMGEQIQYIDLTEEYRLRHSEYMVKSFDYGAGSARKNVAKDTELDFFRPMHIIADRMGNSLGALQRRADMERNRRLARAHRFDVGLVGWGHDQAGPWMPWLLNRHVRIVVPEENYDEVRLISDIKFRQNGQSGTLSTLTCVHRNAFIGEPPTAKKRSAKSRKKRVARVDANQLGPSFTDTVGNR